MTFEDLRNNKTVRAALVAAAAFAVGFIVARKPPQVEVRTEVKTVEDTSVRQRLDEKIESERELLVELSLAQSTIRELQVRTVEKTRIVYLKDGTKIIEKDKTTELGEKTDSKTNLSEKTDVREKTEEGRKIDTEVERHVETKIVEKSAPKDDYYIGISGGIGLSGYGAPGVEFKYRLFDLGSVSFWAGAEILTGPPLDITAGQIRAGIGASF